MGFLGRIFKRIRSSHKKFQLKKKQGKAGHVFVTQASAATAAKASVAPDPSPVDSVIPDTVNSNIPDTDDEEFSGSIHVDSMPLSFHDPSEGMEYYTRKRNVERTPSMPSCIRFDDDFDEVSLLFAGGATHVEPTHMEEPPPMDMPVLPPRVESEEPKVIVEGPPVSQAGVEIEIDDQSAVEVILPKDSTGSPFQSLNPVWVDDISVSTWGSTRGASLLAEQRNAFRPLNPVNVDSISVSTWGSTRGASLLKEQPLPENTFKPINPVDVDDISVSTLGSIRGASLLATPPPGAGQHKNNQRRQPYPYPYPTSPKPKLKNKLLKYQQPMAQRAAEMKLHVKGYFRYIPRNTEDFSVSAISF